MAFCTAHVPRGIDFTDDPLLAARNSHRLSRHPTDPTGLRSELRPVLPINWTAGRGQYRPTRRIRPTGRPPGRHPLHPQYARWWLSLLRRPGRSPVGSSRGDRADRAGAGRLLRRPLQPGHPLLELRCRRTGTRPHRGPPSPSSSASASIPRFARGWLPIWPRWTPNSAGGWPAIWVWLPPRARRPRAKSRRPPCLRSRRRSGPIDGRRSWGSWPATGVDRAGIEALRRASKAAGATLYVIGPCGAPSKAQAVAVAVDRSVAHHPVSVEYDALVRGRGLIGRRCWPTIALAGTRTLSGGLPPSQRPSEPGARALTSSTFLSMTDRRSGVVTSKEGDRCFC